MASTEPTDLEKMDALHRFSEAAHAHIIHLPSALDTKTSVLAAAMAGTLVLAAHNFTLHHPGGLAATQLTPPTDLTVAGMAILALGLALAAIGLLKHAHGHHTNPFSAHGFAAHVDAKAMLATLQGRSAQELLEDRLLHCREVAIVSVLKATWFHRALLCGAAGLALVTLGALL